jgi:hypothetical protein
MEEKTFGLHREGTQCFLDWSQKSAKRRKKRGRGLTQMDGFKDAADEEG